MKNMKARKIGLAAAKVASLLLPIDACVGLYVAWNISQSAGPLWGLGAAAFVTAVTGHHWHDLNRGKRVLSAST